jgi:hypothetical protein
MEDEDLKEFIEDIQGLASGKSFDFLNDEEDIYTEKNIITPFPPNKL